MLKLTLINSRLEIPNNSTIALNVYMYYALNRAGGLYGRILAEVASTDWGQDSPIHTDLARLIRCLWLKKTVALKTLLEAAESTRLVLSVILFTNGDERFGQQKVQFIGRYVFNCSRLLKWLTKFLPRVQVALSLVLSVFDFCSCKTFSISTSSLLVASSAELKLAFVHFLYPFPREGLLILPFSIMNRNKPIFSYSFFVTFLRTTVTTRSV